MNTLTNLEICELLRHTCLFGGKDHDWDHLTAYITDSSSVVERAGLFERLHILEKIFDKANPESIEEMFVKAVKAQLHTTVGFCLNRGIDQTIVQRSLRHAALAGNSDMIDTLLPHLSDDEDVEYVLRVVQQTVLNAEKTERLLLQNNFNLLEQLWKRHKISRELPDPIEKPLIKRKM